MVERTAEEAYDATRSIMGGERLQSKTVHLRHFNNWIKSVLIDKYCPKNANILDLSSGKGGDIPKWKHKEPSSIVFTDISKVSMFECFKKFNSKLAKHTEATFIAGNTFQCDLKKLLPGHTFHIASCQFALHYAFESYDLAFQAVANLGSQLLPGGHVIITTINCFKLLDWFKRQNDDPNNTTQEKRRTIENSIFRATRHFEMDDIQPFGSGYTFYLVESVGNVKEYLIHPTVLDELFSLYDIKRIETWGFQEFYAKMLEDPELAQYKNLYVDIINRLEGKFENAAMDKDEWEICGLYNFYVYQKNGNLEEPQKRNIKRQISWKLELIDAETGKPELIDIKPDAHQDQPKGRTKPFK